MHRKAQYFQTTVSTMFLNFLLMHSIKIHAEPLSCLQCRKSYYMYVHRESIIYQRDWSYTNCWFLVLSQRSSSFYLCYKLNVCNCNNGKVFRSHSRNWTKRGHISPKLHLLFSSHLCQYLCCLTVWKPLERCLFCTKTKINSVLNHFEDKVSNF